jgi:hypothetical protein
MACDLADSIVIVMDCNAIQRAAAAAAAGASCSARDGTCVCGSLLRCADTILYHSAFQ